MRGSWLSSVVCVMAAAAAVVAAERQWQSATWRDASVERPRVMFSAQPRDPTSNLPRTPPPAREIRTFILETSTHRLELRQEATTDTPRLDVTLGATVAIAIEKKDVYVKDLAGKEHKLQLRKLTALEK